MAQGKGSADNVIKRRKALLAIIEDCYRQGIPVTNHVLLVKLAESGFSISHRQLFRDRTIINLENTFLADLGESNYSAFLEDIKDKIEWIEQQAIDLFNTKWVTKKAIKRQIPDKDGDTIITEQQITENEAEPKARFLDIVGQCQKFKLDMLKGDNINIAVDLLSKKMRLIKDENAGLKTQLEKFKRETPGK